MANGRPESSRPKQTREVEIFYVKKGMTHFVRTLSDEYRGLFGHFTRGRTEYCPGARCDCNNKRQRRMWYGFASVLLWDGALKLWLPRVLQITEALDHDLVGVYRRGQVWQLSRSADDENGENYPVRGGVVEMVQPHQVHPAFPFLPTLLRIFHVQAIDEWFPNPVPKKTVVEVNDDLPPIPEPEQDLSKIAKGETLRRLIEERDAKLAKLRSTRSDQAHQDNGHG